MTQITSRTSTTAARKRKDLRILGIFILGMGLLILGTAALLLLPGGGSPLEMVFVPANVKGPAPAFQVADLSGNPTRLTDYRGKVVLANNWATWCPPCKREMPALEKYYQAHKDEGFVLVGINAGDPANLVSQFKDEYRLSFPLWVDLGQVAVEEFNNFGLPSSYLIDTEGNLRLYWNGAINLRTLEKYVTPLLKE